MSFSQSGDSILSPIAHSNHPQHSPNGERLENLATARFLEEWQSSLNAT
ncbi:MULTISPECIES: hypothetical protein [Microcoleaceae]|nr:hypothetical protein [Tychonema sp. LEGE 06208]MBE9163426.1 hypothetical protein [Tychonema sp. LEGE 06208]